MWKTTFLEFLIVNRMKKSMKLLNYVRGPKVAVKLGSSMTTYLRHHYQIPQIKNYPKEQIWKRQDIFVLAQSKPEIKQLNTPECYSWPCTHWSRSLFRSIASRGSQLTSRSEIEKYLHDKTIHSNVQNYEEILKILFC